MTPELRTTGHEPPPVAVALRRIDTQLREVLGRLGELDERLAALGSSKPPAALLRKQQVAELLGVSLRTVERLAAAGVLPPGRRVGRALRWTRDEAMRAAQE